MKHVSILRDYGLFDAKVPRYTSYPPANRFVANVGAQVHHDWLQAVPADEPVSVYVHIPFCRRLCWFCACRTQGTQTLAPVDAYIQDVANEIALVAAQMPRVPRMARLHLGGGTPTLLTLDQMSCLLDAFEAYFAPTPDWEFSVEIDPTEASPQVLDLLAARGMKRASIGVQDFARNVQEAIGRRQSFEQTQTVVARLRTGGVESLNIDLLYGLPFQTQASLLTTLDHVHALRPDRLAIYGYAHVPYMAKRQVMISEDQLPNTFERFKMAQTAKERLGTLGYLSVGIDHFARASDSLTQAAQNGALQRNFQGYTDDPCATLVGFGASAISKFKQGYVQNAVATSAYQSRVRDNQLPGHKGFVMSERDAFLADIIRQIMCEARINQKHLSAKHPNFAKDLWHITGELKRAFPRAFSVAESDLRLLPEFQPLTRVIAAHIDASLQSEHVHSLAV